MSAGSSAATTMPATTAPLQPSFDRLIADQQAGGRPQRQARQRTRAAALAAQRRAVMLRRPNPDAWRQAMGLLIKDATLLTVDGAGTIHRPGAIYVEGSRIV